MRLRTSLLLVASLLLSALLLSGCWTVSVYPLFTADTLTYDERLVGMWNAGETSPEIMVFTPLDDKQYKTRKYGITYYTPKGEPFLLEGRLVQIGKERYLDVYPPSKEKDKEMAAAHHIGVHSFWKVSMEGDRLRLTPLDFDWLRALLYKDPKAIRGVSTGTYDILLTGSTEELQEFVRRYSEQAFLPKEENEWWQRVPLPKKE